MRTFEYALVLLLIVGFAGWGLHAVAGMITDSLNHSAELIANPGAAR